MQYPTDFTEDMRRQGICGVLAIAVAANVTLADAHAACGRNILPHQKRHVRRTYDDQIEACLKELGCDPFEIYVERQNLRKWVSNNTSGKFVVFVSGHVLTVENGMILDQEAHDHFETHPRRRCFVQKVWSVK